METDKALLIEVEVAGERLAKALNAKEVSDVNDYMSAGVSILPPAAGVVRGEKVMPFWLNFAQRTDAVRMAPEAVDAVGPDLVRDVGTLSLRPRGLAGTQRITHKYIALWRREDGALRLLALAWNKREA